MDRGNPKNSKNYAESFSLIEDGIDLAVQEEYLKLSGTIEPK